MSPEADAADAFVARARARLRREPPGPYDPLSNPRGDHSIDAVYLPENLQPREAAVLVPVVPRPEPALLFTQRTAHLRAHSGQIAFPGGKIDPDDPSPLDAALREAEEEIGLDPGLVRPLGYLDPYLSGTGYFILPVVGLIPPGFRPRPNPDEVESTFEVPLGFLLDPARHELHAREWKGRTRRYYAIPYEDRYIWGVTAGIVRNLYERLRP